LKREDKARAFKQRFARSSSKAEKFEKIPAVPKAAAATERKPAQI